MSSCPINSRPKENESVQQPPGSPVRAKILKFYDDLRKVGGVITDQQEFETRISQQFVTMAAAMSHIPLLTNYSKLESNLAKWFGVKSLAWQAISLKMTEAGAVRNLLLERSRIAAQIVEGAAVYRSLPTIKRLQQELELALPQIDKSKIQELLHDHIVIGQYPKLLNVYDSPIARETLRLRYQKHIDTLGELGITDVSKFDELAGEISANLDTARMYAGQFGLDVKQLQNGGYFPIQVTNEIKRFLDKEGEGAFSSASKATFDSAGVINLSRKSMLPAVLDLGKAAKAIGVSELELAGMIGEPGKLSQLLRSKFTEADLERMFENGTLMQIPALSDELTAFFNESLDLPIANLGEAIVLDPTRAVATYNQQLQQAVKNSSYVQTMLEEGVKQGWVIDELAVASMPNLRDYVRIASNQLLADLFTNTKLRDSIANAFVHRTVADQITSLLKINTSWEQLGLVGRGWQTVLKLTGFLKNGMIVGTGGVPYLGRVFAQNAVSLNAATGSRGMAHYAQGLADMTKAWLAKDTSFLSSAKDIKVGEQMYSLRDLFEQTFLTRASDYSSIAGENVQMSAWERVRDRLSKPAFDRFLKYSKIYNDRYGAPMSGQVLDKAAWVAELTSDAFKSAYEAIAGGNQFMDFAARWTAVRSLANNPSYAGRKSWENLNELLRYTDEYFNIQEDAGVVGKTLSQGFVPFAGFALVAPGNALRHALRHPYRYGRMMSLYAQAQAASGAGLTDAELPQWQKDSTAIFVGRNENGELWSINPGTVDYYLDTSTWMRENFEKLGRAAGMHVGSTQEQLAAKLDPSEDLRKAFLDFSGKLYWTDPALAAIGGIDPFTREKFSDVPEDDSLLGFGMSRQARTVLTEALPILRSLDRALPASIVGQQEKRDVNFNLLSPAIPSWSGAVPSTGGNKPKESPKYLSLPQQPKDVLAWVAQTGGLTIAEIDPNKTLISNYNNLGSLTSDIDKALGKADEYINLHSQAPDIQRRQEQRTRLLQIKGSIQVQQFLVDYVARQKNYTPAQAINYVRQKIRTANDIPQEALIEYLKLQMTNDASQQP